MTLSINCHYAECMLTVTFHCYAGYHYAGSCIFIILSVIMLCVIMLSVIKLSVVMTSANTMIVVMLCVIMLSVIMLSTVAPMSILGHKFSLG